MILPELFSYSLRLGDSQPMDAEVKTAIDTALAILKNAAAVTGGKTGDTAVAPTAVEPTPTSFHRSCQFAQASIPSTTTPEQVGTFKEDLCMFMVLLLFFCLFQRCIVSGFLKNHPATNSLFNIFVSSTLRILTSYMECVTLPLQMLPDRQVETSVAEPSPTVPPPAAPVAEAASPASEGPPNRELELAGMEALMKQHEAVQNSLADMTVNTNKVEIINWSSHRKEGMRLKRLLEESPNGVDFPHMKEMWQGTAAATWFC